MSQRVAPLDPYSDKAREVVRRGSEALALVLFLIEQREAAQRAEAEQGDEPS